MAYEMKTRSGRNFYEMTSVMQNSIRKGDYDYAGYAMWELLPKYEPYLRKRFLVISAEDCFGIITKEVLNLCKTPGTENAERALSVLCAAKKNRDADYFVCNLMRTDVIIERLPKEKQAAALVQSIQKKDVIHAGLISNSMFRANRKYLWQVLEEMAKVHNPYLSEEFRALREANESVTKPNEETIFVAKAIVLLLTEKEKLEDIIAYPGARFDGVMKPEEVQITKPVDECPKIYGLYPEWAYNWHTYHGKYKLRRDAIHAIENDQKLLTPLEENLFDDCTWNRDINACLLKWNPRKIRLPYDDRKRQPSDKFPISEIRIEETEEPEQMDMFKNFGMR